MAHRIIGVTGGQGGSLKTVNVVSSLTGFGPNQIKTDTQSQPGQGAGVFMGTTGAAGLPTVFISGYTGPN
jgi:hypothetical protein